MLFAGARPLYSAEILLSSGWRFNIVSDLSEGNAVGAISELTDPTGTSIFSAIGDEGLFDWTAGVKRPTSVGIESFPDKAIAILSGFRTQQGGFLPLKAQMTFTGNKTELFCEVILTATSACRLEQGLGVMIPVDDVPRVDFYNTMGKLDNNIVPMALTEPFRLPFQSRIMVRSGLGSIQVNLRNPLLPVPARTADGVELEFISWYRPNTTNANGLKNLCSILTPGDSIRIEWGVTSAIAGEAPKSIAAFSPHPRGGDCSAYLAFDDIPSLEPEWAVPTDANNLSTPVTSRWLKILDEFADVRFTWLLLTDSIQRLGNWRFIGWWPPTSNVFPDSTVVYSGKTSCRMSFSAGVEQPAVLSQSYAVKPGVEYRFDLMAISDYPQSAPTLGILVYSWKPAYKITQSFFDVGNSQWTRYSVPFVSDSLGVVSITIRGAGASGDIFIDEATLTNLETEENILPGGGFEAYQPYISYTSGDLSWPNAKSIGNLAIEASQEYIDWLKIVQDGTSEWGYTRQVGLGLHGLHHTPDTLFATDVNHTHEFNFYDPTGDSIRMKHIADDITTMGLDTNKIFALFRFPGHRHTESILKPILDHGVRVIDQGNFVDRFCAGLLIRNHRRLWITSSVSWHDQQSDVHLRHLESTLNAGMFSLMGCHYHLMNSADVPGERERVRGLFSWIEETYPNIVWMKGAEPADLWDEFGSIRNIRQQGYSNKITLTWEGASSQDESVFINIPMDEGYPVLCSVDGQNLSARRTGTRVFVSLPELGPGPHRLEVVVSNKAPIIPDPEIWRVIREESETFTLGRFSSTETQINVMIFDATGRQVVDSNRHLLSLGNQELRVTTPASPSGIYFAHIEDANGTSTIRLTRIR